MARMGGRSYSGADGGEQARGRVNKWLIRAPTSAPELRTFGAFYGKMRHFVQNLTCSAFRYICYKLWFFVSRKNIEYYGNYRRFSVGIWGCLLLEVPSAIMKNWQVRPRGFSEMVYM